MKRLILTAVAAALPLLSVLPALAQAPARTNAKPAPIVKTEKKACKTTKSTCKKSTAQKVSLNKKTSKIVASKPAGKAIKHKVAHKA